MTKKEYAPGDGMAFGLESEVEDSFTIILQYDGPQKDLLVTIKTSVTTPMAQQLKHLIRGTKGSWIKEEQIAEGRKPLEPGFGEEPADVYGTLTTYKEFDGKIQHYDEATKKYVGKYPSIAGHWLGVYANLADAINGKAEIEVKATQSRDVIRVIELARESHDTGATVTWK
ncbi:oxidoreductase domain-containing protein [Colletotrichum tofieldiae]|nr:oxidoreductase domain-containing protein [Colletotrichum tofieldiae]